ncbi:Glycerol-3-phosphate/dihydroxyacetone phosphate acyltransferase [Friedmanniomyces endolithicus]|nr:Glycerol-3-phosphate/dihydroxyacetone phosphate acyltransferase [Friedmanniomyces endolithicus]
MSSKGKQTRDALTYDIFLWIFNIIIDLFFREIHPRSTWRIPKHGPVIFVAAPHANQFIDPLILMRTVRQDAKRRIAILIAAKSMTRKFVGWAASLVSAVPVGRALDMKKPAKGKIYLPDPEGDPTLVRGSGTDFTDEKVYMPGGLLVLPSVNNTTANTEIKEVISATEIRLKKSFKGDVALKQLTGQDIGEGNGHLPSDSPAEKSGSEYQGTSFDVAPHINQSVVYEAVFTRIREGGCIGIFPEGGSHDRTELLPLKAGLAIMALGALAENPDCGVTIVPVGMNYFHAHKFRSRAVIEFGYPITIEQELVQQYKDGDRRGATAEVLKLVYERLTAVTTLAPDYDTLMLIQAVRRLYNPKGKRLPLPMAVELNRRLVKGYTTYKDDPRVVSLKRQVLAYNRTLFRIGIRDHQVSYAKFSWYKVVATLIYRVMKLLVLSVVVLPGTLLFAPVFIAGKVISRIKAKEALAASTVKIQARDVIGTWKILVAMALAPALDIVYSIILTVWTHKNRVGGRVPTWVPLWFVAIGGLILFPAVCFGALRFGEIGMDIFKSLRPLMLSISPSSKNTLVNLRKRREKLQDDTNNIINELGPELFPDFDRRRIIPEQHHDNGSELGDEEGTHPSNRPQTPTQEDSNEIDALSFSPATPPPLPRSVGRTRTGAENLPRNDSFHNISSIGIFASRPSTPRSRSRSGSGAAEGGSFRGSGGFGFSPLASGGKAGRAGHEGQVGHAADMEAVGQTLRAAMRERGRRRRSEGEDGWEGEGEGEESEERGVVLTPESTVDGDGEEGRKDV